MRGSDVGVENESDDSKRYVPLDGCIDVYYQEMFTIMFQYINIQFDTFVAICSDYCVMTESCQHINVVKT